MDDAVDPLESQLLQYNAQGFVHLQGVIPPSLVQRAKRAFDSATEQKLADWKRAGSEAKGTAQYYDVPDILDVDDAFVELADLPSIMPLLLQAIGADIQLNHTHARIMFPGKTFTAPWHSDLDTLIGVNLAETPNFFGKVHFYLEDLQPDQGCLAFIPGSHRFGNDNNPRPAYDALGDSGAAVRIVPKAGDAVLFNVHVRHMALDNRTALPRKSIIYAYSHFWLKNYSNAVPRDIDRLATTPLRRQLFGVDTDGVSYFDQRVGDQVDDAQSTFHLASRKLLKRILKGSSITKK